MEASSVGSRSVKKLLAPEHVQEPATPFMLSGVHALLFDDDTLAAFINSPAALLPWNGDHSLLIDRYDVRHLLLDISNVRRRRPAPPLTDVTEEELNRERFRDLQKSMRSVIPEDNMKPGDSLKSSGQGYQAVPFSYSVDGGENGTQTESTHRSVGFHPPFPVPHHLVSKLPQTEKLHQIIAGTAKFVKEHGGQSEVVLKVKQGSNPMFGFLNVDHHLHEYYRYLTQHPELLQTAPQNLAKSTGAAGEGLSLLGVAYGSVDEDDDRPVRSESKHVDASPGELGCTEIAQGGVISNDASKVKVETGEIVVAAAKPVAASTRPLRTGDGSRMKVAAEGISKELPQLNKKKQGMFEGTGEMIQANKRIVPQLKVNDLPTKVVLNNGHQLPKKVESKTSSWHPVPSVKEMNYGMSADAAAAAVFAATRGARALKQDPSNIKSLSSSGLSQKGQEQNGQPMNSVGCKSSISLGLGQSDMKLAKAVAELAAIAASHEADSADTQLSPAEKLKAERLRKAKMFAAMIKSGKCGQESAGKQSDQQLGTSPATTSVKSVEMHADGLPIDGKAVANGKGISSANSVPPEEVQESDVTRSPHAGGAVDLVVSKQPVKERKYRSKEQEVKSDSEDSKHQRKRKANNDRKGDKKRKHSKRRKHKHSDSESADSALSSGNKGTHEWKSRPHHHNHSRRKRSHTEHNGKEESHGHDGHKSHDNGLNVNSSWKMKHSHSRTVDRSCSVSEEETSGNGRHMTQNHQSRTTSKEREVRSSEQSRHSGAVANHTTMGSAMEVPTDIREKVRAMLLATL